MRNRIYVSVLMSFAVLGCAGTRDPLDELARRAREVLRQDLRDEKGLVQVHAADALVALKEFATVRAVYAAQLPIDPASPFRVGAWRSLAGAAESSAERAIWVEKIEREFLDLDGTLRVGAIESLCKIGHVVSGRVLEAARVMATTAPEPDAVFASWALHLAGERAAVGRIASALASNSALARSRAAFVLRWVHARDPAVLARLSAAADAEPAGTNTHAFLISAALALEAEPTRVAAWQHAAETILAQGSTAARYEIGQTLMRRERPSGVARLVHLLDAPEGDVRVVGSWMILHVLAERGR